jgi:hypothetical protein
MGLGFRSLKMFHLPVCAGSPHPLPFPGLRLCALCKCHSRVRICVYNLFLSLFSLRGQDSLVARRPPTTGGD